jgi:hypothetical protein
MPKFLNTLSRATYAIGMCQRCNRKFPLGDLRPDGDKPALRVCRGCRDGVDRNRLPSRAPERISVSGALPDTILLPPEETP